MLLPDQPPGGCDGARNPLVPFSKFGDVARGSSSMGPTKDLETGITSRDTPIIKLERKDRMDNSS